MLALLFLLLVITQLSQQADQNQSETTSIGRVSNPSAPGIKGLYDSSKIPSTRYGTPVAPIISRKYGVPYFTDRDFRNPNINTEYNRIPDPEKHFGFSPFSNASAGSSEEHEHSIVNEVVPNRNPAVNRKPTASGIYTVSDSEKLFYSDNYGVSRNPAVSVVNRYPPVTDSENDSESDNDNDNENDNEKDKESENANEDQGIQSHIDDTNNYGFFPENSNNFQAPGSGNPGISFNYNGQLSPLPYDDPPPQYLYHLNTRYDIPPQRFSPFEFGAGVASPNHNFMPLIYGLDYNSGSFAGFNPIMTTSLAYTGPVYGRELKGGYAGIQI